MKKRRYIYLLIFFSLLIHFKCLYSSTLNEASIYKFELCNEAGCPYIGNILCARIIVTRNGVSFGVACFQGERNF